MEALLALAYLNHRRDFGWARELAERVVVMAEQAKAPAMLAGAHFVLGTVLHGSGQFPAAREHLERSVELFGASLSGNYGAFFAPAASNMLVSILAILGYLSTALSRADELLAAGCRTSDPHSIASALVMNALFHLPLRDARAAAERAEEMLPIATKHEMQFHLILGAFFRGWAVAAAGRDDEAIAQMRRSIWNPVSAETFGPPYMLVALAEACGKNGRVEEAMEFVMEGLATAEQTGLRLVEAELHRIRGELLMMKDPGNVAEADRSLRTGIDVARRQAARLYELRATVSLARLLKRQGKTEEARTMLSEIYNWFTEGFEFPDLKDAKALLDERGA